MKWKKQKLKKREQKMRELTHRIIAHCKRCRPAAIALDDMVAAVGKIAQIINKSSPKITAK